VDVHDPVAFLDGAPPGHDGSAFTGTRG
jgi:hypothetical protein